MGTYRKKPVQIEAALFDGEIVGEPGPNGRVMARTCPSWFPAVVLDVSENEVGPITLAPGQVARVEGGLKIGTLEGAMLASPGDWIIRGVKGEIYPCKPDIFAATYQRYP